MDKLKILLPLVALVLLTSCAATMTNLTPLTQSRNTNGLYAVEVALSSRQQSLRWDSITPYVVANGQFIKMRPTPLMTNRWETLIPVPADRNGVSYRYKFEYQYNGIGGRRSETATSREYDLHISEP